MWHYTEGIINHSPVWAQHGIRILPGPSSLWLDATGRRCPLRSSPASTRSATLEHLARSGHAHSWFVLTQKIIEKEFALSGSEQNPDLTGKDLRLLAARMGKGAPAPVEAFKERGADFVVAGTLEQLIDGMQALEPSVQLDGELVEREIEARDREIDNDFTKDAQVTAIRGARRYLGDRLIRVAIAAPAPRPQGRSAHRGPAARAHPQDASAGSRPTSSGGCSGLTARPVPGLYAAGEASGFGGGGMHGYRALEGTFLGGCLFSGRVAGRAMARDH